MHPQEPDPRGQLLENMIHDFHLVKSLENEPNAVAVHAALMAYAISVMAVNINFTQGELERGQIINGFRVYADTNDAGHPIKIERMQ